MQFIVDSLPWTLVVVLSLGYPILWLLFFKKNRKSEFHAVGSSASDIDHAKLDAATEAVKSLDLRAKFLETMEPYGSFYALHGFSQSSMTEILVALKDKGIKADYMQMHSIPIGTTVVNQGATGYELFVEQGKRAEAQKIIVSLFP